MKFMKIIVYTLLLLFYSCGGNSLPEIGAGYLLQSDGASYVMLTDTSNTVFISGYVEEVNSDSIFIIAQQKPVDSICECNHDCLEKKYSNANDLPTYNMCKKAFENSTLKKYWIVNKLQESMFNSETKTRSNVYGPYSREGYLKKKQDLGVADSLKFEWESDSSK